MTDSPNVYEGMAAVSAALSHIPKQRSQGVSYEFRGIDAVMQALHGPLADNGLFLAPRVLDDWRADMIPGTNNRQQTQVLFRVEIEVYAADGTSITLGPGLAQSHDYGDKAAYQAQQNAIKYLLLEAFCIPVDEPDMDARTPDDVAAETPQDRAQQALDDSPIRDDLYPNVARLYGAESGFVVDLDESAAEKLAANLASDKALGAILSKLGLEPDGSEVPF